MPPNGKTPLVPYNIVVNEETNSAEINMYGEVVGVMGQVHPLVAKNYGMDCEVYCAEIDFTKLFTELRTYCTELWLKDV